MRSDKKNWVAIILLIILTIWWIVLQPFNSDEALTPHKYIWGSSYQLLALWGAISGFFISSHWGGYKSKLGRAILAFSIGLLFQVFGQTVYSYYNLFAKIEAPYPSLGDIGFFGSIPMYIYGCILLANVSGVRISLKTFDKKIQAFFIPFIVLFLSYLVFLKGYAFDLTQPLKIFLDFGYPLGQAVYISIAILTLLFSWKSLGGRMKRPVTLFLAALIFQYICDYNFLFQSNQGTWLVGGYGDYIYALSYFFMTIAIIFIGRVFKELRSQN